MGQPSTTVWEVRPTVGSDSNGGAFVPGASEFAGEDRMGILTGSILAACIGYAVTAMASHKKA